MTGMYILDGKEPVECEDAITWGKWFSENKRHVADEKIGDVRVSTVFLGIDHSFTGGAPVLFETMVFGGPMDGEMDRCGTWERAELMHAAMVHLVKDATANAADKGRA